MLWTRGLHPIFIWIWHVDSTCQDDKLLQLYSNVFMGQVDFFYCTQSIQIKERRMKRSKNFGEMSHFLNFALCVFPREKQAHTKFKDTSFVQVSQ